MKERLIYYLAKMSYREEYINITDEVLDYMKLYGSSVNLTWDEESDKWTCSWISSGKRFTGIGNSIYQAIHKTLLAVKGT
jgi:hypothetical protein